VGNSCNIENQYNEVSGKQLMDITVEIPVIYV